MATQKYLDRLVDVPGENIKNPTASSNAARQAELGFTPGRNPTAGPVKTPAPTRPAPTPDEMRSTSWGRGSYGANGWGGASSLEPGATTKLNALTAQPDPDPALALLQQRGLNTKDEDNALNTQIRDIGDNNVPVHSAFAKRGADSGSPGGTVPLKNGNPSADFDARRAAAVKRTF